MLFGLIWPVGAGALSPERQRERFDDLDAAQHKIVEAFTELPRFRQGDTLVVCTPLALADDVIQLAERYREILADGGEIEVDGVGRFSDWDRFPELLAAYEQAKRRKQTSKARSASKKRHKGARGLTDADKTLLRKLWRDPNTTKADIAKRFGVSWVTVNRWEKSTAMKLGPKAKPNAE